MSKKDLFVGFEKINSAEWRYQIAKDLNIQNIDELKWTSVEGIDVGPIYHIDEAIRLNIPKSQNEWNVGEYLHFTNMSDASKFVSDAAKGGADSIYLDGDYSAEEAIQLIRKFEKSNLNWHVKVSCRAEDLKTIKKSSTAIQSKLNLHVDPIGHRARIGDWLIDQDTDLNVMRSHLQGQLLNQSQVSIDMSLYQNAGANIIQQLAFGLSHANEYLNLISTSNQVPLVTFNTAVGSNYFFEIAKLRALRWLWQSLLSGIGFDDTPCHILTTTTERNKTIYSYNNNLLRSTTECMSAALGGADTIVNMPYDHQYHNPNDFGQRIARNQLLILKHESFFQAVQNPTDGTYYIDYLTHSLANQALELFKSIEAKGGFIEALKSGVVQASIKNSATKEQEAFDQKDIILLGVNAYKNEEEKMSPTIDKLKLDVNQNKVFKAIIPSRLADEIEKERMKREKA